MAIQKVWLHGRGCECGACGQDEDHYLTFDNGNGFSDIDISTKMTTYIKDQYGQMYIITPIPFKVE